MNSETLKNKHSESKSAVVSQLFTVNDNGVFYQMEEELRWICSKLEVKALVRDKESENWGRLLEFPDDDGQLHTWAMPMEALKGSREELRGELLRQGLEIAPGGRIRNLLMEYIISTKPAARARCVNHTGWFNTIFVFPYRVFGDTKELVIYQSETPHGSYSSSGTLQEWQRHIAAYCVDNLRLILAVACSFAAMLLHPAGMESGGIHLVGESSTGKTTALRIAASVFGGVDYLHRWRATTNGLEALAALRSDTLLVLDELAQVEAKEAGEIAYMLANGSGKARANKNGTVRSRYEWRLLFLSAGEVGLAQHISEAGKKAKAGQEVRLIDMPADAGVGLGVFDSLHNFVSGAELSKMLTDACSRYYGIAALAFLERVTQTEFLQVLPDTLKTLCKRFISRHLPDNSGGQVHRVCERFALIAAAGELASDLGITDWPSGIVDHAVAKCFNAWREYRGCDGNQDNNALLTQVQAFFEAHGASRFEDLKPSTEQRVVNRVGFKYRNSLNEYEYFVLPQMFRQEVCAGFNPRWAAQILLEAGMLKPGYEGKALSTHRLGFEGVKKCYHFVKTEAIR